MITPQFQCSLTAKNEELNLLRKTVPLIFVKYSQKDYRTIFMRWQRLDVGIAHNFSSRGLADVFSKQLFWNHFTLSFLDFTLCQIVYFLPVIFYTSQSNWLQLRNKKWMVKKKEKKKTYLNRCYHNVFAISFPWITCWKILSPLAKLTHIHPTETLRLENHAVCDMKKWFCVHQHKYNIFCFNFFFSVH